jgi:nucleoside diphosphate kinase
MTKSVKFDENQAIEFYADQKDKPFFDDLVKEMTRYLVVNSIFM